MIFIEFYSSKLAYKPPRIKQFLYLREIVYEHRFSIKNFDGGHIKVELNFFLPLFVRHYFVISFVTLSSSSPPLLLLLHNCVRHPARVSLFRGICVHTFTAIFARVYPIDVCRGVKLK